MSRDSPLALEFGDADRLERPQLLEQLQMQENIINDLQHQLQAKTLQLQQTLQYQATLRQINERLQDPLDEAQILQTVVAELIDGLDLTNCQTHLDRVTPISPLDETVGRVARDAPESNQREPFADSLGEPSFPYAYQVCELGDRQSALLVCPITYHQETLGKLCLYRDAVNSFSDAEIDLVQQVSSQCAIALRHARLHHTAQTQLAELEKLNQIQDEFLNTVSYELRIPMANMKMAIQMLCLSLDQNNESQPEANSETDPGGVLPATFFEKINRYLAILRTECDREAKLIANLLDLQQLDTNTMSLVMSAIRLPEWLPYIVTPLQKRCQEYQLGFQLNIPPDIPPIVCDQISLSRILTELLNNACKYTPNGGQITVTVSCLPVEQSSDPARIQIQVCNTGVEIPADERDRIFDKFYRIPHLDIRKLGGTGLGLALVQKLIARLGGKIYLKSDPAQTCFIVELTG